MDFRQKRRELPRVDITALIDIVFLLVIFLMITTTFKKDEDKSSQENANNALNPTIDVALPESSTQKVVQESDNLEIWIDEQGQFFIDNQNVGMSGIRTAMREAVLENPDVSVIIKGDKKVDLGEVVTLMDLATESKVKTFSLGTTNPDLQNK